MEMFQRSKAEHKNKQMEGGLNANDKCSWVSFEDDVKACICTEENINSGLSLLIETLVDAFSKPAQRTLKVQHP